MDTINQTALQQEWTTLQFQYDSYEKFSLILKLFSVVLCSLLVFHLQLDFVLPILCLIIWMLDGIWKTFQSRIGERLLVVEKSLRDSIQENALQYNTQWELNRPNSVKLIANYLKNALSPTVFVPHLAIISLALIGTCIS
ncbi:hypothetical protein [Aliiglaciecola lipolytica]|uniref:Uncharacterized protein n=1 Tax=Aliiglaciecola lipolytica E3 TaxID=1127673 RepID=K6XXW7_9ALTE|nr:hypothetical protein [Aliiglaciecola lipolytica]GAC16501.1 hypothetical protein GLIP_3890 [Aliiglaciecola lipolytica E3]